MQTKFVMPVLLVTSLILSASACDSGPTRPQPATGVPQLTRLELQGPGTIAPGENAQFKLIAHLSNGTSRDVAQEATWNSSQPSVATIQAAGRAVAHERGDTVLTGAFGLRTSTLEVIVVPTGTFRVTGRVVEDIGQRAPIAGARVEDYVTRMSTTTDGNGEFKFYGVGRSGLHISQDGYFAKLLPVSGHHSAVTVSLSPKNAVPDISGSYLRLTISAGPCTDGPSLSAALKTRTYTARVTQQGQGAQVVLGGQTFAPHYLIPGELANRFVGLVGTTAISFSLTERDFYYSTPIPTVIEQFEDGTFLSIDGEAQVTLSGAGMSAVLSGVLDGTLRHYRTGGPLLTTCTSRSHGFVMTR